MWAYHTLLILLVIVTFEFSHSMEWLLFFETWLSSYVSVVCTLSSELTTLWVAMPLFIDQISP
jgi:hypothetical protein